MSMSATDVRSDDPSELRREQRRELWHFWGRVLAVMAAAAVTVAFILWTYWMAQRYLILGDDTARGERFRDAITATATGTPRENRSFLNAQCQIAAESFYNHGILGNGDDGPAPPNEKAFLHACSGAFMGGHGGGGD
ncbi:MAG TPA: hypothetical protein VLK34_01805 [Nocardioidaceae bacterium]|nr:hypothetical protein [Nocardioidaceae bacterium]